jgi:uncharacterized protein YrrD
MSVKEGQKVGSVQDIVVDPQKKKVEALVVRGSKNDYDFHQLKIVDVMGIGKDFVILQSIDNVKSIETGSVGVPLLNVQCIAASGDVLGTVTEFEFDEKSGDIKAVKIDTGIVVQGHSILSLSNSLLFVQYDASGAPSAAPSSASALEKEQKDYMIGRVVKNDVKDESGNIVVAKGTMVNASVIEKAQQAGVTVELMLELE